MEDRPSDFKMNKFLDSTKEDENYLFLNEALSDVTIVGNDSGTEWRFPVHSPYLTKHSPVFQRMLNGDFKESKTKEIVVNDIDSDIMLKLLRFMYNQHIDLENWKLGIDVLKSAHMYQIEPLVMKCSEYLENELTLTNACYIYSLIKAYPVEDLKEKVLNLILDAGFVILRSNYFEEMNSNIALEIISHPFLNVDSELSILKAVIGRAKVQCSKAKKTLSEDNVLSEMEPFLQHICFENMSEEDRNTLPESILENVKESSQQRSQFRVPKRLLPFGSIVYFKNRVVMDSTSQTIIPITFSINFSVYFIAFKILINITNSRNSCNALNVKVTIRSPGKNKISTFEIKYAEKLENCLTRIEVGHSNFNEINVQMDSPIYLNQNDVCNIIIYNNNNQSYQFETKVMKTSFNTFTGNKKLMIHSEKIYNITELTFL